VGRRRTGRARPVAAADGGLLLCALVATQTPAASGASEAGGDCQRVESEHLVLHNDPWINLHHFLFQWARNMSEPRPGDRRPSVEVPERTQLGSLEADERQVWGRAVGYCREKLVERDLLFDGELVKLRGLVGARACEAAGREASPPTLEVLADAMPVYRRHWWPGHAASNTSWIEEQSRALQPREEPMARRLAAAYGSEVGLLPGQLRSVLTQRADVPGAEDDVAGEAGFPGFRASSTAWHRETRSTYWTSPGASRRPRISASASVPRRCAPTSTPLARTTSCSPGSTPRSSAGSRPRPGDPRVCSGSAKRKATRGRTPRRDDGWRATSRR